MATGANLSATVGGTTETAVGSTEPFTSSQSAGNGCRVNGIVSFTGNASASTVTLKVRQGVGIGGTTVYTSPAITVAAAAVMSVPYDCIDTSAQNTPGIAAYTVTATFSLAPGAAGAVTGTILAQALGYYEEI